MTDLTNPQTRIFIAGHKGMVGSAILRLLKQKGYQHLITRTRQELDLTDQRSVDQFFQQNPINHVILAAAKVGGIHANNTYPADFIFENLAIEQNIIRSAFESGVKRLLFLGSTCIYPKNSPQPMNEDALLTGKLEPTNEPYAIAKIAGIKMCESLNRQHGTDYRSAMPTNLYGPGDLFHPENSHVLPALMMRFHQAKINKTDKVTIWGSGKPIRDFLHVDDMANACLFIMELDSAIYHEYTQKNLSHVNIGSGIGVTIKELALMIQEVVGYSGKLEFDSSKPDGTLKKVTGTNLLKKMGWSYQIKLKQGIEHTYNWFLENFNQIRQ